MTSSWLGRTFPEHEVAVPILQNVLVYGFSIIGMTVLYLFVWKKGILGFFLSILGIFIPGKNRY
jgi:hypothetical protein